MPQKTAHWCIIIFSVGNVDLDGREKVRTKEMLTMYFSSSTTLFYFSCNWRTDLSWSFVVFDFNGALAFDQFGRRSIGPERNKLFLCSWILPFLSNFAAGLTFSGGEGE